ncbi:MAG: AmmeMemoRadiSam system protein B [Chloroflexota bacterium]|jgi:MEMO1 family protein
MTFRPRLRPIIFQPIIHQEQQLLWLRDPWDLSDRRLVFPRALAQVLPYCDGRRTPHDIHRDFVDLIGQDVSFELIHEVLEALDDAYLLDNERSQEVIKEHLAAYRAQSQRPPALAGISYPAFSEHLTDLFEDFESGIQSNDQPDWPVRGIVSPHIDYQRGGPIYAGVWLQAAHSILTADLVIILGTDHNGTPGSITLTRQAYATPYGRLPTELNIVDALAEAIGPETAFAEELNHRGEHSIELSAVWLHYLYKQAAVTPSPMIPILVGSFQHHLDSGTHPADDPRITGLLNTLSHETSGRRTVVVASVDLAHVGPTFGDDFFMDAERRDQLRREDDGLIKSLLSGDSLGLFRQISDIRDRNRICGFSPLYLLSRYLCQTEGIQSGYRQCPADENDASLVSICGLLLK